MSLKDQIAHSEPSPSTGSSQCHCPIVTDNSRFYKKHQCVHYKKTKKRKYE